MPEQSHPPLALIEAIIAVATLILLVALSYYLFRDGGTSGPNQVAFFGNVQSQAFQRRYTDAGQCDNLHSYYAILQVAIFLSWANLRSLGSSPPRYPNNRMYCTSSRGTFTIRTAAPPPAAVLFISPHQSAFSGGRFGSASS